MSFRGRPIYPNHREREAMILSSYAGILMVRKRTLFASMKILHLQCAFYIKEYLFYFSANVSKYVKFIESKFLIFKG